MNARLMLLTLSMTLTSVPALAQSPEVLAKISRGEIDAVRAELAASTPKQRPGLESAMTLATIRKQDRKGLITLRDAGVDLNRVLAGSGCEPEAAYALRLQGASPDAVDGRGISAKKRVDEAIRESQRMDISNDGARKNARLMLKELTKLRTEIALAEEAFAGLKTATTSEDKAALADARSARTLAIKDYEKLVTKIRKDVALDDVLPKDFSYRKASAKELKTIAKRLSVVANNTPSNKDFSAKCKATKQILTADIESLRSGEALDKVRSPLLANTRKTWITPERGSLAGAMRAPRTAAAPAVR